MLIRDVDLPDALLDAQQNGSLVIFAGAGVSVPPPSNYPNFEKLAEDVAKGALARQDNEPVDRFLGRLVIHGVRVHERVRKILSDPNSTPNPLHTNLLRLFRSGSRIKLVTTNFDLHFTTAARSLFKDDSQLEIYSAPALPLGDAFSGLVYLHASVDKPAERLVLTDADFGRGYLTEGWARRFLQRLFSGNTVLFVGYSHSDPVMNYLARGLPPESGEPRRFALTLEDERERWQFLGATPIVYPGGDGQNRHSSLGLVIAAWADRIETGALDQEEQIRQIAELPVDLSPEKSDYILSALRDAATTRFFTRFARHPSWLRWIESKGLLKRLFLPDSPTEPTDRELAFWFAEHFVCEHRGDALAVVNRQGQLLNEALWLAIAFHLFRKKDPGPAPEVFAQWVPVLMNSTPHRGTRDLFDYILARLKSPDADPTAILLFDYLTRPRIVLKKDLWAEITKNESEDVKVEITAEGDDYWLNESWHRIFRPRLDDFADRLVWIVTSHLEQANLLLQSFGGVYETWDALNSHRNVIESSAGLRNVIDILVDAGREILELYIATRATRADFAIEMWVSSECRLLRRLAIYGVAKSTHWNADTKLDWIIRNGLLYAFGLKHEVFLVLQNSYPGASQSTRAALVAQAGKVPGADADDKLKAYQTYNLLHWLHQSAPECPLAKKQLDEITAAHPEFGPKEHPDLDVVIGEVTDVVHQSPITLEELISKPAEEQMDFLLSFKPEYSPGGLSRNELLSTVWSATKRSFEWGKGLAHALETRSLWDSDLWPSVVDGWKARDLTDAEWAEALHYLRDNDQILKAVTYQAAMLLQNGVEKPQHPIPGDCLLLSLETSEKLWAALASSQEKPHEKSEDWLTLAINHPAGILAEFWLHLISRLWTQSGQEWTGIPVQCKAFFESVLSADPYASELARIVFASHLHFFFASDKQWALEKILPLLDYSIDPRRALQCWHGYLGWGRWLDALLPYLLPLYEKLYPVMATVPDRVRDRFCEHLADIACFGSINPLQDGWLNRFLSVVGAKQRERWASAVLLMLKAMKEPAKESAWEEWMRQYWQNRIQGIPVPLEGTEAGEMAEWSLHLEPVFAEVVEKICSGPPPVLEHSFLYYELADTRLPERYPHSVAQLLLYLLQKSTTPIYDFDRIDMVFEKLVSCDAEAQILLKICDELAKSGYAGASRLRALIRKDHD